MSHDDDIDPDAKMRVTGKLEAHFPDIPNPAQYDPMAIIVRYMREAGMEVDMEKVRKCEAWLVAKACEMFPNEHTNPFASRLKPLPAAAKVIVESTPNLMQAPKSITPSGLFTAPSGWQWIESDSGDIRSVPATEVGIEIRDAELARLYPPKED